MKRLQQRLNEKKCALKTDHKIPDVCFIKGLEISLVS